MKCERIIKDDYGKKEYIMAMKIGEVRKYFKIRVGLFPFGNNDKNYKRVARTTWMCRCVEEEEDQGLIRNCSIYSDITYVDDDENLVKYLHEVLMRRDIIENLENQEDN